MRRDVWTLEAPSLGGEGRVVAYGHWGVPVLFFPASLAFTVIWKLFDMFIGLIQAFIFALLTILYYQFAVEDAH